MGRYLLLFAFLSACAQEAPPPVQQPAGLTLTTFHNNEDSIPVLDLIRGARSTLDIEIYMMWDRDVFAALHEALDRGVRVRVVIDGEASSNSCQLFEAVKPDDRRDCQEVKALIERIRASGEFVRFNKESLCNGRFCHQHGKMLIADGQTALVSTGNFNSTNLCNIARRPSRCNRDYFVITRDPTLLRALNRIFAKDLAGEAYELEEILNEAGSDLTVSPYSLQPLVEFVNSARNSIYVQNQYLKDPNLNQALVNAARRGVRVEVTTSSTCFFGRPNGREEQQVREIYGAFDEAGISSRMFTQAIPVGGLSGYLHAKGMVVDLERAWVGSVNGSTTALNSNREFGLFFTAASEVLKLSSIMADDHLHEGGQSWEESLRCAKDGGHRNSSPGPGPSDFFRLPFSRHL
jgi:cardiolipin synthase A/B